MRWVRAERDARARASNAARGEAQSRDEDARASTSADAEAARAASLRPATRANVRREIMTMNDGTEREITVDARFKCAKCARGSSCFAVHRATSAVSGMRAKRRYNERKKAKKTKSKYASDVEGGGRGSRARADADPVGATLALIRDGHRPTAKTFTAVISTLGAMGRAKEALDDVLPMIEEYGDDVDVAVWNAVAHAFCAGGDPAGAEKIVDRMVGEDGVGVNGATHPEIIYTYAKRGEANRVYRLIRRMSSEHGIIPDERAYNAFLRGLCERDDLEDAEEVLRRWNNEKFDLERQSDRGGRVSKPSAASYGLLIDAWTRRGNMLAARKLLQQMQWERIAPSLPLFNMLIDGYLKQENMRAAEGLFRELESSGTWDMESLGIKPDNVTYTLFLDYWANQGQVDACERIFNRMHRKEVAPDVTAYGTLVKAYARARDSDGAEAVLDRLAEAKVAPSVAIYSAVVAAHCTIGNMSRARDVLERMFDAGLRPNERTFAHFAWGYGQLEDINGIAEVAKLMLASGLKLKGANRTAIVRACEECGMSMSAVQALLDRINPEMTQRKGVWKRDGGEPKPKSNRAAAAADDEDLEPSTLEPTKTKGIYGGPESTARRVSLSQRIESLDEDDDDGDTGAVDAPPASSDWPRKVSTRAVAIAHRASSRARPIRRTFTRTNARAFAITRALGAASM